MSQPERPRTVGDVVRLHAAGRGDKIALRFEGRATSYAELDRISDRVAFALRHSGIRKGDRISFLGKNCDSYFELLFGAAKAGAVMSPANWRLAVPEIVAVLADAGVRLLFVTPEFADMIGALRAELPKLETIIPIAPIPGIAHAIYPEWRDTAPVTGTLDPVNPDDVAVQIYTSGTTGKPKGAMLTHRSLLTLRTMPPDQQPVWNRFADEDMGLIVNPVFHISGTGYGLQTLCAGATGLVLKEFDASRILDIIHNDNLSRVFVVPASLQMLLRHPKAKETDFSRVRYVIYGASPIPLELLREAVTVFRCGFVQMYGMTETSGTVVSLGPEDHDPAGTPKMRSAGKPHRGVELAILDKDGTHLPIGQVGEVAVRSPSNMAGYWNMPEATSAAIDRDGWLRTGDAGYLDDDGYLFLHDRVKDMIISGGENIYPVEVENAIFGHPDVGEVAVIGVPSEKWGEEVKAMVVPKPGAKPDAADIIAWARARIAGYKIPKSIEFIDALPRNPTGKVLRRELRDRYWAGRERKVN